MEKTIVYLEVEEGDMDSGLSAISFVDLPATEVEWTTFSKQEKKNLFLKNETKRVVTSPVMLAETEIYRNSPELGEYYTKFSADTIFKMVTKYFKDNKIHKVNEMHDTRRGVPNAIMIESFIVGDRVKSELYPDLPEGSWIASFYIQDENYWNDVIMSDQFTGFSLEGYFIENYEMSMKQKGTDALYNSLKEILNSDNHDFIKELKIKKLLKVD